jgi:hypothetical protein
LRKTVRAFVKEIISGDGGDDDMGKADILRGTGYLQGLPGIERRGIAFVYGTE